MLTFVSPHLVRMILSFHANGRVRGTNSETRIEPEIHLRRPVLLWKHHVDGAVLCGRAQPATPVGGS